MCRVYPFRFRVVATFVLLAAAAALQAQPPDERPQAPRGFLGVFVGPAEGDKGVLVREVTPDSPAAKAGLKKGDLIVRLDDKDVRDGEAFFRALGGKKPGDQLKIGVLRDDKEQSLTATVGERPNRVPTPDSSQPSDPNRRIRELERRIEELEKRVRDLEKK